MKLKIQLLILVLLLSSRGFGQVKFSVDFLGTYSFIRVTDSPSSSPSSIPVNSGYFVSTIGPITTQSFESRPGLNINFGVTKQVRDRICINSGLGLSFIQFRREVKYNYPKYDFFSALQSDSLISGTYGLNGQLQFTPGVPDLSDDPIASGNPNIGKTKMLYLSIPLRIQYSVVPDKFAVGIGVINYFVAYASEIKTRYAAVSQVVQLQEYSDRSGDGYSNYLLGGILLMEYKLFKGIWAQLSYNHTFSRIYDAENDPMSTESRVRASYRTVGLGVSYKF